MSGPAGAPWLPDDQEAPTGRDRVRETALDIGGSFTFARGASPGQIMAAFGMNPAKARLVQASGAAQALPDPDRLRTDPRSIRRYGSA